MSKSDPEKLVKDKIRRHAVTGSTCNVIPIPLKDAVALMNRLQDYRNRIKNQQIKFDGKLRPLIKENAEMKQCLAWARDRLDPEGYGTFYSAIDQYEVADLIGYIEKKRGALVARRLLYGHPADLNNETIGVLNAAVKCAKDEEARWREYLANAQRHNRAGRELGTEHVIEDQTPAKVRKSIWRKLWAWLSTLV